jgi:hypothetical membrane protein
VTSTSSRVAALCGLLAPVSFVGSWAVWGALRDGYDPVEEAISQLARMGTPDRWGMTAGFVGFGVLLPVFARELPRRIGAGSGLRATMTVAGVSTLAVAAFPLQREPGGSGDLLHAASAGIGYLAMAAAPAVAAGPLSRSGRRTAARASVAVSAVSTAALVASITTGPTGLWQRVGLGVVDAWYAAAALSMLRVSEDTVQA